MPGIPPQALQELVMRAQQGDPNAAQTLQQLGYGPDGSPAGPPGGGMPGGPPPGMGGGPPPGMGGGPPMGGGGPPPGPQQQMNPAMLQQAAGALRGGM